MSSRAGVYVNEVDARGRASAIGLLEMTVRTGIGYDLHPFAAGRTLVLGGVSVPHPRGLEGHSDADALTHAVIDALIGASGGGDIGQWFPDSDPQYAGANSVDLLRVVGKRLADQGWVVGNVDSTIVAQRPTLSPFLASMRNNIAGALEIDFDAVNVKATSPEYVGSLGREDAIVVLATVLIQREA